MDYYLVGGAIRDLLNGKFPDDFDWVHTGTPASFAQAHPNARPVGKEYPIHILAGSEFAAMRGSTIRVDLQYRDFTLNAMALAEGGHLYMHPDALTDLQRGILRPVTSASFVDDPLRIFRAARLLACHPRWRLAPSCLALMRDAVPVTGTLAAERVGNECMKAMCGLAPHRFLLALASAGALAPWFQELEAAQAVPAGPVHAHGQASVFKHTLRVMRAATALLPPGFDIPNRGLVAWMALCHDIGKVLTPGDELPRHLRHEYRGEALATNFALRLHLPGRWVKAAAMAARWHMVAGQYSKLRPGTKVDLLVRLMAADLLVPLSVVAAADTNDALLAGQMMRDGRKIREVRLPADFANQGKASGDRLRQMRCEVIADDSALS